MGPLLLAALATFGSTVAIGIIAAGTPRPAGAVTAMPNSRRLAVILFALAGGSGIWGVLAPLLAATNGSSGNHAGATLIPLLPILGAVVALALLMGSFSRLDPWILARAAAFIVPQILLPIIAAVLTIVIPGGGVAHGDGGAVLPFAILGLVAAASAIGLGILGVDGVRALAVFDGTPADDPEVRRRTSAILVRCIPFELLAVGSALIGIILVVRAAR